MKTKLILAIATPLCLAACGNKDTVTVTVSNPTTEQLGTRSVEIPAAEVLGKLKTSGFYVTDSEGTEIPSQLTYDHKILFSADVPAGTEKKFTIHPSDSIHTYTTTVSGDFYPKRRDDIAYENELVGFRLYGPGTQKAGEKSFGYDLFLKHPTSELIVPSLYAAQTSEENWAKVDSLRKVDPAEADKFEKSFTYHLDHGKGMDCYAVGATLGAGVAALLVNDSIAYPWCYDTAEILDNGPLRFTLAMNFAPKAIGTAPAVTEHRLITLDSQSHLNNCKVWYEGFDGDKTIVTGFPLRDDSEVIKDSEKGIIAYADPTQGPDNGKALVGVVLNSKPDSILMKEKHVLMSRTLSPTDTLSYSWGFAWDRTDIPSLNDWKQYLNNSNLNYTVTLNP
ncbi:MAG: DUF4861 domain-containing protein [Muribaculaceae bacterium]|nr:DUF4861 domain-containing protein [Muribaculaceae bacterium]